MSDSTFFTFRIEDEHLIPESAGVYAYLYNPFQKSRLGIFADRNLTEKDIQLAKVTLNRKLKRYSNLKNSYVLAGEIREQGPYLNSYKLFAGQLRCQDINSPWLDLDGLSMEEFIAYISMAEKSFVMFQSLYCGMTVDQGLKSRYKQHKIDHERERKGTFGGRLADFSISWQDILFVCAPMTMSGSNKSSIELLERHLIYLLEPILSMR